MPVSALTQVFEALCRAGSYEMVLPCLQWISAEFDHLPVPTRFAMLQSLLAPWLARLKPSLQVASSSPSSSLFACGEWLALDSFIRGNLPVFWLPVGYQVICMELADSHPSHALQVVDLLCQQGLPIPLSLVHDLIETWLQKSDTCSLQCAVALLDRVRYLLLQQPTLKTYRLAYNVMLTANRWKDALQMYFPHLVKLAHESGAGLDVQDWYLTLLKRTIALKGLEAARQIWDFLERSRDLPPLEPRIRRWWASKLK
eukprot:TRINITY_DN7017_c0_g3_i3.p1 TRINITY_DN7017_c0_g3~~TRINITY_DN7017_c0_g3_i3.p1  ORF type:complete len:257 (+),score=18.46 TRINITY_DN7017_c0_g3_i3:216-986(+)